MSPSLYFDHAASAPLAPGVAEAVQAALTEAWANPDSAHPAGRQARARIDEAAESLAALLGCSPAALVWTSGATESINLALRGHAAFTGKRAHIVSATTEHRATLDVLERLEAEGARVDRVGVDASGRLDWPALEAGVAGGATLVSVAHVNNETGVLAPIAAIGQLCAEHGVVLHVDAAQSAGRVAVDVAHAKAALVSLSAHKFGGPKGVGALYVRPRCGIAPQIIGGGQQRGLRSGTLATHQIMGMGAAARHAAATMAAEQSRLAGLRERLWARIAALPGVTRNAADAPSAAAFLNVSVAGVHGEALRTGLAEGRPSVAVSGGSACGAARGESSHVLRAMGRDARTAAASVRFSLGAANDRDTVERAGDRFVAEVERLRALAPAA